MHSQIDAQKDVNTLNCNLWIIKFIVANVKIYLFSSFKRINVYFIVHLQFQRVVSIREHFSIHTFLLLNQNRIESNWKWTYKKKTMINELNPSKSIRKIHWSFCNQCHLSHSFYSIFLSFFSFSRSLVLKVFNFVSVEFRQLESTHGR